MIRALRHFIQLYGLAVGLRRYGALRALAGIELVPAWAPMLLRVLTFYIPRRRKLPKTDGERLALALAGMGPTYIKIGQMLATRPDIVGLDLAEGLATLQDKLPPFAFESAQAVIKKELGASIEELFAEFDPVPVAAASIAQVHKAKTTEGDMVAVKIVRPDVDKLFKRDLKLFAWLAEIGERHSREARRLRLGRIVRTLEDTVFAELNLANEAYAAKQLSLHMEGEQGYRIPDVDGARSSKSVMTLEWIDGIRLMDKAALKDAGHDLEALGAKIVQIFLIQALRDGYFHADLHQGNLLVEPDGTVVAIDFGMIGTLNKRERRFLAEILYGFIKRDYLRVAEVHFDAGYVPRGHDTQALADALKAIADPIMDLPVEEISAGELLAQLFATTERFDMQTQPQLLLLQRTMVMAEGMALHLYPKTNMWTVSEPVIEHWIRQNLSPEVLLADALRQIPRMIERLPMQIDQLMDALDKTANEKPSFDKPPMKSSGSIYPFIAGVGIGALLIETFF